MKMVSGFLCLVLVLHYSSASQSEDILGRVKISKREGDTCNDICVQYPTFCNHNGLCIDGTTPWTARCLCDPPYWGRRCQYNSVCNKPEIEGDCFYGNITGKHTRDRSIIWLSDNTKPGEVVTLESEEIAMEQDYKIILSYTMAIWDTDHNTDTPVFKSPNEFDSIEIKTRSCGNVNQTPFCWRDDSPSRCITPPENRPCLWNSNIVYSYHVHSENWEREKCIDLTHNCDNRNFFQFGLKAKCNNSNGCNSRSPQLYTWKEGTTFFKFRLRVEPGRCLEDGDGDGDGGGNGGGSGQSNA